MLTSSIKSYTGGMFATNGYLLDTPEGLIVIDAPLGISSLIPEDVTPLALLLTHQHFDHVDDAAVLAARGAKLYAFSPYDPALILAEDARRWGVPTDPAPFEVHEILKDQSQLSLAGLDLSLLHVPGHSPDSLCYHLADAGIIFGGDTLFQGSVGRTDLPGGQHRIFIDEIRSKLLTLPPETTVYPGHGPTTTIAAETAQNQSLA